MTKNISGRNISALFNPRPLFLLSSRANPKDSTSEQSISTIIWASPVTHTPPRVCISVKSKSKTLSIIKQSGYFSLSTLAEDTNFVLEYCGTHSGWNVNKFDQVKYIDLKFEDQGMPLELPVYSDYYSCIIARVEFTQNLGTHSLVVGEVVKALSNAQIDEKNRVTADKTLLCIQRDIFTSL